MKFMIRSDFRCVYNEHINGRLQEDFGNGNGVNKGMGQKLGLPAWTEKVSRPSCRHPWQVLRAAMVDAPVEKTWFDMMIKDVQGALLISMMVSICSNATLNVFV